MKHTSIVAALVAVVLVMAGLGFAAPAQAELPVVDGHLWAASSVAEKRAYLIGVANTVAVHRALQTRRGKLDPTAPNNRFDQALNAGTIDRAIEQIDDWYSDNPGRKGDPVPGVVWQRMVKGR